MEDLKTILQKFSIAETQQILHDFVYSAESTDDKVKLLVALISLIEQSSMLLKTIDTDQFIVQLRKNVEQIHGESSVLTKKYNTQLLQDSNALKALNGSSNEEATKLQQNIESLLTQYDKLIKDIIEVREKLPIQSQMQLEKA